METGADEPRQPAAVRYCSARWHQLRGGRSVPNGHSSALPPRATPNIAPGKGLLPLRAFVGIGLRGAQEHHTTKGQSTL